MNAVALANAKRLAEEQAKRTNAATPQGTERPGPKEAEAKSNRQKSRSDHRKSKKGRRARPHQASLPKPVDEAPRTDETGEAPANREDA